MSKKDMTAVISRCLEGDSFAQEELVLAVQDRVYYHCRKMLKDEDRAFDLSQDVLITMITKLNTLQSPDAFWSWLGGITANLCRNAISRGPREVQIPEDEEGNSLLDTYETLDEQTVPDKALDNDETRRMIAELVDELPDAQRQCVLLYYYDEMSVKDIANSLDVSENTVKSRLNYARKSIKEGVDKYEKQGIKLYSMSPLPLLLFFLGKDAAACGMSAEKAAELAQRVAEGASAAAVGAGAAAAGSSVSAATAAKTGVLGLSTKAVAGIAAGVVAVGGIAGGVLLSGDKDADFGLPSMDYIDPPAWVDYAFDELDEFFPGAEISIQDGYTDEYGNQHRACLYSIPGEDLYISMNAELDDTEIISAYIDTNGDVSLDTPIGWQDICLGDTMETVLRKLGIEEVDLEEIFPEEPTPQQLENLTIHCHFYPDDPEKSYYSGGYFHDAGYRAIFVDYFDEFDLDQREGEKSMVLWFEKDGRLTRMNYDNKAVLKVSAETAEEGTSEKTEETVKETEEETEKAEDVPKTDEATVTEEVSEEAETDASAAELSAEDIGFDFAGTMVTLDTPYKMYSPIYTRTEDSYYAVDKDAVFTVTNNSKSEDAFLCITLLEYLRSTEHFESTVRVGEEFVVIDIYDEFWNYDEYVWLSDTKVSDVSAGDGLYWSEWDGEGYPDAIRLAPGESVTFRLPMRSVDSICRIAAKFMCDDIYAAMPGTAYWVSSANSVMAPSTTAI